MKFKYCCEIKPYIQPFEVKLAVEELAALTGCLPVKTEEYIYEVETKASIKLLLDKLTYFNSVYIKDDKNQQLTKQFYLEATSFFSKGNQLLDNTAPFSSGSIEINQLKSLINRRVLRYGSHGIHEYRGKFFPQMVKSLLNISNQNSDAIILDPMCGSGTTVLEAMMSGYNAYGIDLNPLSVLISRSKCDIFKVSTEQIKSTYNFVFENLENCSSNKRLVYFETLSAKDQKYLFEWFSKEVLLKLDAIILCINKVKDDICRNFFLVSLSNILRKVSWQKNDDLRVRKDIRPDVKYDVFSEFKNEIIRSINMVNLLSDLCKNTHLGNTNIIHGNTTDINILDNKVDVIITSPPYATALPYLDTDRLSLYYLGIMSRADHRDNDYKMIGNREISKGMRISYWEYYIQNKNTLPSEIVQIIDRIYNLNLNSDVGFRRKNLASLLAKYFFDMQKVMLSFTKMLKSGAYAYVVVGNNHTIAGGQRVDIETNNLLAILGESVGLKLRDKICMEMLASRDIFKNNASNAETIIFFENN